MNSLVFTIAIVCAQQPAPPMTVVSAYNSDKTFRATLSMPSRSSWADSIRGDIRLQNVSADSRYVYDMLWPSVTVFYENVGEKGMWGMWNGRLTEQFPLMDYMRQLAPSESVTQIFTPYGWDFDIARNGVYKVVIAFDDSALWPANLTSQRIGRIRLPLTLKLTDDHLEVSKRGFEPREVSVIPSVSWECPVGLPKPVDRRARALKSRR